MKKLSLEMTHELLDIVESDYIKELLKEFIVLYAFDESDSRVIGLQERLLEGRA